MAKRQATTRIPNFGTNCVTLPVGIMVAGKTSGAINIIDAVNFDRRSLASRMASSTARINADQIANQAPDMSPINAIPRYPKLQKNSEIIGDALPISSAISGKYAYVNPSDPFIGRSSGGRNSKAIPKKCLP